MAEQSQMFLKITLLKDLALGLSKDHPLRAVMEVENDELTAEEFCAKLGTWLRLLDAATQ